MLQGADWFRQFGTEKSPGTKVFALSGNIVNTGLVEVPVGTPLSEVIYSIGGGIPNGKKFKSAQTGGPSGGCITAENINTPLDYESLAALGSIVGSGGFDCHGRGHLHGGYRPVLSGLYFRRNPAGKCTACRIGTKRMLEILNRITAAEKESRGTSKPWNIWGLSSKTPPCAAYGQTAPNPVLSTIPVFPKGVRGAHCGEAMFRRGLRRACLQPL